MMAKELYELWKTKDLEDADLTAELAQIADNDNEIYERFYRQLEFGTAGLRGIIGAGTNRMNIYTVRSATQGLADYLNETEKNASVAIAYDSRNKSELFATTAAEVLAGNGITAYIYKELMPTPMLSFAVRHLKCASGIVITASHNPAAYNGYKAYGPDGCQMTEQSADAVLDKIGKVDMFDGVKYIDMKQGLSSGLIKHIEQDVIEQYYKCVLAQTTRPNICKNSGMKIVFTPLNGAGNKPVREILSRIGIDDISVVKEQENPDGNFTTCTYPNPEIKDTLKLGIELCKATNADLLLATDPDCDRVGIAVKDGEDYRLVTGNEVGVLLMNYIIEGRIEKGTMPKNPVVVKSIVTTGLANVVGESYGVEVRDVLTGFKYIGEQIAELEAVGEQDRFLLGFEESYGYLSGTYVRDKDAVVAPMLIAEMAAYYKSCGKSICEVLEGIYSKYGCYMHSIGNFVCEGASGMERMAEIMSTLRTSPPSEIGGFKIVKISDYKASIAKDLLTSTESKINLPSSNVLSYDLENGCNVIIRPSGTEPKIKAYYTIKSDSKQSGKILEDKLSASTVELLGF